MPLADDNSRKGLALHEKAVAYREAGDAVNAVQCFRAAIAVSESVEAHYELSRTLFDLDRFQDAVVHLQRATELRSDFSQAYHLLGLVWRKLGNAQRAAEAYRMAIRHNEHSAASHNNLGNVLRDLGDLSDAVICYRQATKLDETYADAHNNLGVALSESQRYSEAIHCYQRTIALQPDCIPAHYNLGNALQSELRIDEAIESFSRAIDLDPDHAAAHHNRALLYLLKGDFEHGYEEYEWRWQTPFCPSRSFDQPAWSGEDVTGSTVLLHAEQGLGDTIQFVRFAKDVKRLGARVILECQPALRWLLENCSGVDRLISRGDSLPAFDFHVPLMSLPRLLKLGADVPGGGYLFAERERVSFWKNELGRVRPLRVGIQWQGRPEHPRDSDRSLPLSMFRQLAEVPGVSLIVLQQGAGREQMASCDFPLFDLGTRVDREGAFLDTAAILTNLDVLVTCDTAVAHLAGALGVETWILLPFFPDWRWLLNRSDTFWYESVRLFRQSRRGEWAGVLEQVADALRDYVPSRKGSLLGKSLLSKDESSQAARDEPEELAEEHPNSVLRSSHVDEEIRTAIKNHRAGLLDEAAQTYQLILRANPNHVDALHLLGLVKHQSGDSPGAEPLIRRAIAAQSEIATLHIHLGIVLQTRKKINEAADSFLEAIRLAPGNAQAQNGAGSTLLQLGRNRDALGYLEEAVRLQPDYEQAHLNLCCALIQCNRMGEASEALSRFLTKHARNATAHYHYATVLQRFGRIDEAAKHYEKAIDLRPEYVDAWFGYGLLLADRNNIHAAITKYQRVLELSPGHHKAQKNLCHVLQLTGRTSEAEAQYQEALRASPSDTLKYASATLMPVVYNSHEEIGYYRERTQHHLQDLVRQGVKLDPLSDPMNTTFFLAYQGKNDRQIHRLVSKLSVNSCERRQVKSIDRAKDERIRVGFVSKFLRDHTIGRLWRGVISQLCRDRFEVEVYSLHDARDDGTTRVLKERADHYVVLPSNLRLARDIIAERDLDILYYSDIGMAPASFALATNRLAEIQCVTWGHPVTTGLDTIDYFISSRWMETAAADQHYSEKLVCLDSIGNYYYRAQHDRDVRRTEFGLDNDWHVYLCPQSTFKFHPDFDNALGEILRRDPHGRIVLLKGLQHSWDELLLRRFETTIPDVVDRVCFVPRQSYPDFLGLLRTADVMIDTFHFGGGNTTYEALSFGIPVVTLPSEFLRGRISYGLYQKMGVSDCIADDPEDFVNKSLALGTNADYRHVVSRKITEAHDALFEDRRAVTELEELFSSWMN